VPKGRIEDLTTLGLTDSIRTVELYVEGIQTTAGVSLPISIELIVGDRIIATDLVTVVVVSNTLVIGIDGTGSEAWLSREVNGVRYNERTTPDGTRWNSHVRNLVEDSWPFAMTIYRPGPVQFYAPPSDTSGAVFRAVRNEARNMIVDAGGGTTIAIVGWSRGAMIASGVANDLLTLAPGDLPRTVVFVGMYDPVDMSDGINDAWARVHRDVKAVTIVGPADEDSTRPRLPRYNVDYSTFTRMALGENTDRGFQWRVTHQGTVDIIRHTYNASHGAIGGTPGYNEDNEDPPAGAYNYVEDRRDSIQSDKDIRDGMRRAGLEFVPERAEAWYGFPAVRPPSQYWE
jgi:hypothetical protein